MKRLISMTVLLAMMLAAAPALGAPDAKPATKAEPAKTEPKKAEPKKMEAVTSQPVEPVEPAEVPKDAGEAMSAAKQIVEMGRAKQWFAMSAGIIWLLMFIFKVMRKKIDAMKKIPKRVLWIIVPVLSVAAMLLAKLQADLSWGAALAVLFSGPSVAFLNDLVKRGFLGREPSSPVNGGAG